MKRRLLILLLLLCIPTIVSAGQIKLTWDAPITNADGTPISYFGGNYVIYYGTSSRVYPLSVQLTDTGATVVHTLELPDGNYFFAVTAVNTLGNESAYSNEVNKIVTTTVVPRKPTGLKSIKIN
jgi:hypothetical protein